MMSRTGNKTTLLTVGETLNQELQGLNRTEVAGRIGVSRSQLYNLLNNRGKVRPEIAEKLSKVTNRSARYWLNLAHENLLHSRGLL